MAVPERICLKPVIETLPQGFAGMCREARAEGYAMLDRLMAEWESGGNRFTRRGEALLAAYCNEALAGIGGMTVEPAIPDAFRMRRFYVRSQYRRHGVARRMALALLDRTPHRGRIITVNAARGSGPFWEALGFDRTEAENWTHMRRDRPP